MSDKSSNKTWWKFSDNFRINTESITEIICTDGTIMIYRDGLESTLTFRPSDKEYEQAQALLEYIDRELCINGRK